MLGTLAFAFTSMAESSVVLSPAEQQQVAAGLDEDAQLMSDAQLEQLLVGQPADVQAEIIRINEEARPISLQAALLVPLFAGLIGLFASFAHDAPEGRQAIGCGRRDGLRLTLSHGSGKRRVQAERRTATVEVGCAGVSVSLRRQPSWKPP